MPTTKPRSTARTKKAAAAPLPSFDNQVDAFKREVLTLAWTRVQIAQLNAARSVIFERLKDAYNAGHRAIPGSGGLVLKQTAPGEGSEYLAVSSAAAQKADKAAWQRAKIPKNFVQVKAPEAVAASFIIEHDVPVLHDNSTLEQAAAAYREHPAWDALRQLTELEAATIEKLDKLGADFGWDGLPLEFREGWSVQLKRMQFDSERLALVEPALFEKLAELKVRQAAPRVYIGKPDEDDETSEFDGE